MAGESGRLFDKSNATLGELKNDLTIALLKVNANIYLAQFMLWVFNTSHENKPLKKSYDEIASKPWGLCCSRNQAFATVKKAERLRILDVRNTWTGPGIQGQNEYRINWPGVRQIAYGRQTSTPPTTCDPDTTTCDPDTTTCDPDTTTCDHYKEYTFSHLITPSPTPTRADQPRAAGGGLVLVRTEKPWKKPSGPVLAERPFERVAPDHAPSVLADASAWQAIGRRLALLGVYADLCERLLAQARSRGATPADVAALADHFASRPQAWTAGALTIALKRWSPGQAYDAAALWPPPSDEYRKAARREAAGRLRQLEATTERNQQQQLDQERQAAADQEARWGPRLDALGEEQLAALIASTPRAQVDVFAHSRKCRPIAGLLRSVLLGALEQSHSQSLQESTQ